MAGGGVVRGWLAKGNELRGLSGTGLPRRIVGTGRELGLGRVSKRSLQGLEKVSIRVNPDAGEIS